MRKFVKHMDYLEITKWFHKRNIIPPPPYFLPDIGVIEDNVAAGFLVKTDTNLGYLDFFISNPDADRPLRKDKINEIIHMLIMTAKRAGLKGLKCDTGLAVVNQLAIDHGFQHLGKFDSYLREL